MNKREQMYEEALQKASQRIKELYVEVKRLKQQEPIAVIGIACRFPMGADSPDLFWKLLENGVDATREIPPDRWEAERYYDPNPNVLGKMYTKRGSFLKGNIDVFDSLFFEISPIEAESLDPQQRLLLEVSWEAFENAGLDPVKLRGSYTGVFIGMIGSDYQTHLFSRPLEQIDAYSATGVVSHMACGRLSYFYDFRGPSLTLDTACASSLVSVHYASESLRNRSCDLALAGGVQLMLRPEPFIALSNLKALSLDGRSKSFDVSADGYGRGEGCGLVILKRLSDALHDGDKILAVIAGSEVNHDGRSSGLTAPNGIAEENLIRKVLERANISPDAIDYVEAHAPGTPLGDQIEVQALGSIFKKRKRPLFIGTVKSNIGHLEAGAGIAGFIKVVLALQHKAIPPSIHCKDLNPHIPWEQLPIEVVQELIPWEKNGGPRTAGVSSFGLCGTISHVILQEPRIAEKNQEYCPKSYHLLSLSVKRKSALLKLVRRYHEYLLHTEESIQNICYTTNISRTGLKYRLAIVGASKEDFIEKLSGYLTTPEKLSFYTSKKPKKHIQKTVFLFTGQGSQYPGMGRELYESAPEFRSALERCDAYFQEELGYSLLEFLYASKVQEENLNRPIHAQPAIFSVEYALSELWQSYGVRPALLIGHSIGEYAAACCAGILTLADAVKLVATRARVMQSVTEEGRMVGILASEATVGSFIKNYQNTVSIAAVNTPENVTISGTQESIEKVLRNVKKARIFIEPLPISHAFHSVVMEPYIENFREELTGITFHKPTIPIISTLTGKFVDSEMGESAYWSRHVCQKVRFYEALQLAAARGYRWFVEIGGTATLTGLAAQVISDEEALFLPSLRKGTQAWQQLLTSLAELYVHGGELDWKSIHQPYHKQKVWLPTYPFERKRYWKDSGTLREFMVVPRWITTEEEELGDREEEKEKAAKQSFARTPEAIQQELKNMIQEVSNLDPSDIDEDEAFLVLGLDSLMLVQIRNSILNKYAVDISIKEFLGDLNTLMKVSLYIDNHIGEADAAKAFTYPLVSPDSDNLYEPFPLTEVQMAYVLGRGTRFEMGNISTHTYLEFETTLDIQRLNFALRKIIQRHPMLRAIITADGQQRILPEVPEYEIHVEDLSHLSRAEQEQQIQRERDEKAYYIFPLGQWPMFEIKAFKLFEDTHYLMWGLDFLITDAGSIQIWGEELFQWYHNPDLELPELQFSFRDYLFAYQALKESAIYARDKSYWTQKVADFPTSPVLPFKCHPSEIKQPHFNRLECILNQEEWRALKQKVREHSLTPSAVLCTVYAEVLSCWSNQPDLALDLTVFKRYPFHEEINKIVGDFTSIMIIDIHLNPNETFWVKAEAVQDTIFAALEHQHYDGVEFIRDLANYWKLETQAAVPFVFTSLLVGDDDDSVGTRDRIGTLQWGTSQTPQVFIDHQAGTLNGKLLLTWDYVEDLFEAGMIEAMFEQYVTRIKQILTDEVEQPLTVTPKTLALIEQYNQTREDIPSTLLHYLFQQQISVTPLAVAVQDEDTTISYKELDEKANQVARCLQERYKVGRNDLVAVLATRTIETIVYLMGILKAGAAYVPIDPNYPDDRQTYIYNNSRCKLLLTKDFYVTEQVAEYSADALDIINSPEDLAYVIYTSGSTGRPKGVVITHGAAANTIQDINRKFHVNAQDALIGISSLCFDLSVYDVFGALSVGARLVLIKDQRDFNNVIKTVKKYGITVWNSVPAIMNRVIEHLSEHDPEELQDEMEADLGRDSVYYWNPVVNWEPQGDSIRIGDFSYSGIAETVFPELYFLAQDGIVLYEVAEKFPQTDGQVFQAFIRQLIDNRVLVDSILTPAELFMPQNQLFTNTYTEEIIYVEKKYNVFKKRQLLRTYNAYDHPQVFLDSVQDFPIFIRERRSYRNFNDKEVISRRVFSKFLSVLKQTFEGDKIHYFYPSISGTYPIDLFVYVKAERIEDIAEGLYYYHPGDNSLSLITDKHKIPAEIYHANNRSIFESSAFSLFMIYNGETACSGQEGRSFFEACIETGIMVAALSQIAQLLGLGLCSIGAFNFDKIKDYFKLHKNQIWLHTIEVGLKGDLHATTIESHVRIDLPTEGIEIHSDITEIDKYWWAPGMFWKSEENGVRIGDHVYAGAAKELFPRLYFLSQHGIEIEQIAEQFPQLDSADLETLIQNLITDGVLVNRIQTPERLWAPQAKLTETAAQIGERYDDESTFLHQQITRTYKRYHHLPKIFFGDRKQFPSFIKNRRLCSGFRQEAQLSFSVFSALLSTFRQIRQQNTIYYYYASAGGLYPIDVFVYVKKGGVENVDEGLYYYTPIEHGLHPVPYTTLPLEVTHNTSSAVSIFFVYNAEVSMPKYSGMGYFFACIDTGIMVETLHEVAEMIDVGVCPVYITQEEESINSLLLSKNHVLIQALGVGIKPETTHLMTNECSFGVTESMLGDEDAYISYHPGQQADSVAYESLRLVLLSGDWIPVNLPDKIKHYFPQAQVISLGGATEASIWSIYYPVDMVHKEWTSIPYGMPLANQEFYVLNYASQLCEIGVKGELYIGGVGVAQGYMNDEKKTQQAFMIHPTLGRIYRTGDYGILTKQGYIEFHGRQDTQIKIRGYRIELGEIESVLREHIAVEEVLVIPKEFQPGDTRLIAYVMSRSLVYWDTMEEYFETHNKFCRRTEPRVKYRAPCTIRLANGRHFKTMTEDISYTGLGLEMVSGLVESGDTVRVIFPLPQNSEPCEIEATIAYVSETRKGLTFEFSSETRLMVKQAVDYLIELYGTLVIDYRRGEYRIPLEVPCLIHSERLDEAEAYTTNISFSGIGLKDVPDKYRPDTPLKLMFHLPNNELHIHGIVQWGDHGCAGVRFSANEESLVRNFVEDQITIKGLTIQALRAYIQKKLPAYMVPSIFIFVDEFPLTPNGKIDRKSLPDPTGIQQQRPQTTYVAPKTRMENLVVEIFKEVLGTEEIGVKDNFFEFGATSVHAIQVVNILRDQLKMDIPILALFEYSTIQAFAQYLAKEEKQKESTQAPQPSQKKRRGRDSSRLKQRRARAKRVRSAD